MSAAIDIGSVRTKLSMAGREQPVVMVNVLTAVYVPRHGPVLVGDAARDAIAADPAGAVLDLKSRLGSPEILRQCRSVSPFDLLGLLLNEVWRRALMATDAALTDCILTVPTHFDERQREMLCAAARRAGFTSTNIIDESLAAVRHWEQKTTIAGNVVVVCDLGRTIRITVVRRPFERWRVDWETLTPLIDNPDEVLPRQAVAALQGVAAGIERRGLGRPPLLMIGSGAKEDARAAIQTDAWAGEVVLVPDASDASALGAVDLLSTDWKPRPHPSGTLGTVPMIDLAAPDGTLCLGDEHRCDIAAVLAACRSMLRDVRKLHLIGVEWQDEDVRLVSDTLRDQAAVVALEVTAAGRLSGAALHHLSTLKSLITADFSQWRSSEGAAESLRYLIRLPQLQRVSMPLVLDRWPHVAGVSRGAAIRRDLKHARPGLQIV